MYLKEKVGMTPKEIKGVTNNGISLPTMTTDPRPASGHSTAINIVPWSGSIISTELL